MEDSLSPPLHHFQAHKLWGFLNRTYAFLHFLALVAILYYRGAFFFNKNDPKYSIIPSFPWVIIFAAELFLSFVWVLKQPLHWFPVARTVFPERLPEDSGLPGIDVFICTADPEKEPTFGVMNTVISAMSLDYPCEKLSIYLSDDGGASITLMGLKEAWAFATWWLPFCRRYNVKPICPQAFFEGHEEESGNMDFIEDRKRVKEKYEIFKDRVQRKWRVELQKDAKRSGRDHPAVIEVINADSIEDDAAILNLEHVEMPHLVYVAREKKPSYPHHFKAGAINVLLRVSSTMSNSPYILVLDCDMYCNDSISARQAMCFYVDPKTPRSLAWVQYPQKFHNIHETDIYDSQMRTIWTVYWPSFDGLQGPVISGTNFYIKREALYGFSIDGSDLKDMRDFFGPSNEFLKSLSKNDNSNAIKGGDIELSPILLKEAHFLASCTYEKGTKWGEKVGFRYDSLTEDLMTGLYLQSKGWRSVYVNPARPQFLGSATTNLNEALVQGIRWHAGILDIGLSKYCPLIYRPSRMQFLHKLASSWIALFPLDFLPVSCLAIVPPLCFLYGIPLFPKVSDPFFVAFAFVFVSSRLKGIYEHFISGGSIRTWLNDQRMWMIKSVSCAMYGALECVMAKLGLREASFIPTNKAGGDDKTKYYQMGMYDFRTSNMFLVPLVSLVTLNLACLVGGIVRVLIAQNWDWETLLAQVMFSFYTVTMSFPVIEGMLLRKDDGRVPLSTTVISSVVSLVVLSLGYLIFVH